MEEYPDSIFLINKYAKPSFLLLPFHIPLLVLTFVLLQPLISFLFIPPCKFYSYYFLLSFNWNLFFPTHLCPFMLHFLFSSHLPCLLQLFVSAAISYCFTHHNRPIPPFSISISLLSMLNLCCYLKDGH
jgi:hypothetical protein